MEDTGKYLIHATFATDGVVERSDVVGAVFGQTEGLLGDELDIRDLQESAKLGRIDVEVESHEGSSHGEITIASSLDRVETATLAAALETIERIGPCHATVEISHIEDVRAAKRRTVIDRATELLNTAFDETVMDSEAILQEVRERIRVADITQYQGLPAGPNVATSDAIIVVEGRADVLTLLRYGIKNAIAVEGTNVPERVGELTREKTVTAFLDGDRGGELIRRELEQIGDVDFVAHAPEGKSVEDLSRAEVDVALRNKIPISALEDEPAAVDSRGESAPESPAVADGSTTEAIESAAAGGGLAVAEHPVESEETVETPTMNLDDHLEAVLDGQRARLLAEDRTVMEDVDVEDVFDAMRTSQPVPWAVVLDGPITQRLLDVAAQRGIGLLVGTERGEFVKQPATVSIRTAEEMGVVSTADSEAN